MRNQGEIPQSDQVWFTETILPQLAGAGLKYVSLLGRPQNHYFELLGLLSEKHGISVRTFSRFDEARAWMETVAAPQPVS